MTLDVERLEQSFVQVRLHAAEFSARFYDILFTDYPQVQPLFARSNMAEQKKKLIASLELVVANLRNPDTLVSALVDLGRRHQHYGVTAEHYPMVGSALLKAFEQQLADDWTGEVRSAWTNAFGAISQTMQGPAPASADQA